MKEKKTFMYFLDLTGWCGEVLLGMDLLWWEDRLSCVI